MRKKKIASYLAMIVSLLVLSAITPLIIGSISASVAEKIRGGGGKEEQGEKMEKESETDPEGLTALDVETERETDVIPSVPGKSTQKAGKEESRDGEESVIVQEVSYYDEPVYKTSKEEDAANARAYQDMTEKLKSLSEAASDYRQHFDPVYEELRSGIMNTFISGREALFYEDIANYCFGRYNTTKRIALVRFDAVTEDNTDQMTVILEFFSNEEIHDETRIPHLAYCSLNKKTNAFIFYESGG